MANFTTPRTRTALVIGLVAVTLLAVGAGLVYDERRSNNLADNDYVSTYTPAAIEPVQSAVSFAPPTDRPTRVLFTGDSLTASYFATSKAQGFKAVLTGALGPVEEFEAARAGQTLTTVSSITEVPPALDLAVVELGTNDFGEKTPYNEFRTSYGALLDRIKQSSPEVTIACVGTWQANGLQYDTIIADECARVGGAFSSLRRFASNDAMRGPADKQTEFGVSDDFHPNDRGHYMIANEVITSLGLPPLGDYRPADAG